MSDLISRSVALETINEVDISDCTDVDDIIDRVYADVASVSLVDAVPVVHDIRNRTSFLRVEDVNKWQSRIILDEGEKSKNCAVFYREMDSDLAPVVHARWRWTNGHYECTACGGNRFHDLALGCDASYCPRCGARMDGEAE